MAGLAGKAFVGALERESCLTIVIEMPDRPCVGIVALGAFNPQRCFVHVLLFVARNAGDLGVLELHGRVTVIAGEGGMHAEQWEPGEVVFEEHALTPRSCVVAAGTVLAELLLMDVVVSMAGLAACELWLFFWCRWMTGLAGRLLVLSIEREARRTIVAELRFIPTGFAMALFALRSE